MAEIKFDNLYDQLGLLDQKFYDSTFKNTYDANKSQPMLEMKPAYDQMKAVYEAEQQVPKKSILDSINIFSSADAAMPDNQYGIGSIDMSAYYTPDQQALMFGDRNYFGNNQTNNLPFTSMADMAAANENFMDQFRTGEDFQMVGPLRGTNVMEGSVIPPDMNIRNYEYPRGTDIYSMDESVYDVQDPWSSFYGNPELYQGFVERGDPLPYEPKQNWFERLISGAQNQLGDAWTKTKDLGTRFKEGAAPVWGLASMIGNATNPLNPKAFNYNPELAGQLNFIDQQFPGMMINDPNSGILKYAKGTPLQGQAVMSGFGSNDPINQLKKQMARHQKTIDNFANQWSNLKETDIDAYNQKLNIHKNRLQDAKTLHDTILANKKSRIAERIKNERAAGAAANQATQRRAGRGGDHMSRSISQGGLGISKSQAQAISDANRKAGMGGWNLARGGRVGYANGGLASLFTRRG